MGVFAMRDQADGDRLVERISPHTFPATLERVRRAIENAGLTVFAQIDHAANAAEAGLSMPPAVVLVYGHARGGTPLMLESPHAALDLPLRVLVRQDASGASFVAFHPVAAMLVAAGVSASTAARLEPAQALLIQALSS